MSVLTLDLQTCNAFDTNKITIHSFDNSTQRLDSDRQCSVRYSELQYFWLPSHGQRKVRNAASNIMSVFVGMLAAFYVPLNCRAMTILTLTLSYPACLAFDILPYSLEGGCISPHRGSIILLSETKPSLFVIRFRFSLQRLPSLSPWEVSEFFSIKSLWGW